MSKQSYVASAGAKLERNMLARLVKPQTLRHRRTNNSWIWGFRIVLDAFWTSENVQVAFQSSRQIFL